ncbi:peptidoglycan DD-metalloendopeptidase family protein, partial [bacterium]|nr:peptidoglycan DD-metalloendopeptidase family protein [bacterium]
MRFTLRRLIFATPPSLGTSLALTGLLFLLFCQKGTEPENRNTDGEPVPDPSTVEDSLFVLRGLGVEFGPWNRITNRAGDFLFKSGERKVFIEFGSRETTSDGRVRAFPAFEYRIVRNTPVQAVARGRVVELNFRAQTGDYRIVARSIADPRWDVCYSHVREPQVAVGDTVDAGRRLGIAGPWSDDLGRFQIMVVNTADRYAYCPMSFFDSSGAASAGAKLARHMGDWEAFKRDAAIYNQEGQVTAGCGIVSLNDTEAEIPIPEPDPGEDPNPDPTEETEFRVRNLGVEFGPWNPSTHRAGDFLFKAGGDRVFVEFGARVTDANGVVREFPAFEFRVLKNTSVRTVASGRVVQLDFREDTQDYGITVRSEADPQWDVLYGHLRNPRVTLNASVSAGSVLGDPGEWDADLGRFHFMIVHTTNRFSHCPFSLFDPATVDAVTEQVSRLMADWEAFKDDPAVYDEAAQASPGCAAEVVNHAEIPELYPAFFIHGLGVRFGPWDRSTNRAGDFLFKPGEPKVFSEFGDIVPAGGGQTKVLNTFEYKIVRDALVTAIAEGRVEQFNYQSEMQDYEILVR